MLSSGRPLLRKSSKLNGQTIFSVFLRQIIVCVATLIPVVILEAQTATNGRLTVDFSVHGTYVNLPAGEVFYAGTGGSAVTVTSAYPGRAGIVDYANPYGYPLGSTVWVSDWSAGEWQTGGPA